MKLLEFTSLSKIKERFPGKKIVQCHGVFDLFHCGHLEHLTSAKKFGDILIVTITPDKYVNKGPLRPAFNQNKRVKILAALSIVDFVSINISENAETVINEIKPDYYVKGPDYLKMELDISKGIYRELSAVESIGGKLVFTDDQTESSTTIINNHLNLLNKEQQEFIEKLKITTNLSEILNQLERLKDLKVLVVGEPIIDHYVFCKPENLSSKSPTVSANFINENYYAGGVWAVAAHLASLGCKTNLLAPRGGDLISESLEKSLENNFSINVIEYKLPSLRTPKKSRFISPFMNQRMFELTDLDTRSWYEANLEGFINQLEKSSEEVDVILALDFGHGLWEKDRLKALAQLKVFKAINVQTNSGNYGFNLFHKHEKYNYLTIDERELRLGMNDRFTDEIIIAKKAFMQREKGSIGVTLGVNGSAYFSEEGNFEKAPIFFDKPIDTTGAGDAFFAITTLLTYNRCNPLAIIFLGNIFAGLKTKIVGNEKPVSIVDLVRVVKSLIL